MSIQKLLEALPEKEPAKDIAILIVDDDPLVLEVLERSINSFGYCPTTASDGLEACQFLAEKEFQIVITDIYMPNMDGMELLKHTREKYPETGVIVVTGYSDEYTYVDVIKAGAIDYLTKPFVPDELFAKLHRVIREQGLIRKLEQLSIRDALTGIYNRRHFDKKIAEELHRATRQYYSVFLALIDVDHFKRYNDTYGHLAGDELLKELGDILSKSARYGVDYPFRYGGDEFALILTHINQEQAKSILERINASYQSRNFGDTSLSSGLAEFTRNEDDPWKEDIHRFFLLTDNLLYKAKNKGRGIIICQ